MAHVARHTSISMPPARALSPMDTAGASTSAPWCPEHHRPHETCTVLGRTIALCPACLRDREDRTLRERREARWAEALAIAELPAQYAHVTWESFLLWGDAHQQARQRETIEALRLLVLRPDLGAVLLGPSGAGKTLLACALLRAAVEHGRIGRYATARRYLDDMRAARMLDGEDLPVVRRLRQGYLSPELLVLDELEVRGGGEYERRHVVALLGDRCAQGRQTVLVGGLSLDQLAQELDAPILDRLRGTCLFLPCEWPSYRGGRAEQLGWPSKTGGLHA